MGLSYLGFLSLGGAYGAFKVEKIDAIYCGCVTMNGAGSAQYKASQLQTQNSESIKSSYTAWHTIGEWSGKIRHMPCGMSVH